MEPDTIVVGAGAGGCVVARRLADAGHRVLLLEAGPSDRPPTLRTADASAAFGDPVGPWFWPDLPGDYRQGRGVGGGTAVNGLVVTAGNRSDYDRWHPDGWSQVAPAFDRALAMLDPEPAAFGPLASALAEAASRAGHDVGGSTVQLDQLGFAPATLAIAHRRRRTVADAYLDGDRPSVTIQAETEVERVLVDGDRVAGVVLAADGVEINAGRVVLSAGALQTPAVLRRSGLAAGDGVWPVEDHPSFVLTVALAPAGRQRIGTDEPPVSAVLRWASARGGRAPDLLALVLDHVGADADGRRYGAVIVMLTGAESRGRWESDTGHLDPGWLDAVVDRQRLADGVRHVGRLLVDDAVGPVVEAVYLDDVGTPLADIDHMSDGRLAAWLSDHPGPVTHVASTVPPGSWSSPTGLDVIDASVLPSLPNATPMLPVMALAEHLITTGGAAAL